MSHLRRALIALLLPLITACTVLPGSEHTVHPLPAAEPEPVEGPAVAGTLRVAAPRTSDFLASNRIAVAPEEGQLQAYGGARWPSPVPRLWQDHVIDGFRTSGAVAQVIDDAEDARADWHLAGTLRTFHLDAAAGQARVALDARLIETRRREVIAAERFAATAAAEGEDASAAVEALGRASEEVVRALIRWTMDAAGEGAQGGGEP